MSNPSPTRDDDTASPGSSVSSGWDEEKEYVVEEILGKRVFDDIVQYFVRWQGYPEEECSWEPASSFGNEGEEPTAADEWEDEVAQGTRRQDDEEITRIEALKQAKRDEKRGRLRSALFPEDEPTGEIREERSQAATSSHLKSSSNATTLKRRREESDATTASRKKSKSELPIVPKSSVYKPPAQKFNTPYSNTARKSNRAPIKLDLPKLSEKRRANWKEGQLFKNSSTANRVNKAARQEPNPNLPLSELRTVEEIDQHNARVYEARAHDPLGAQRILQTVGQRKLEREALKAKQNIGNFGIESTGGETSLSLDPVSDTHNMLPPAPRDGNTFPDGKRERWGKNGRIWHPDEIVIDLSFGKNHVGDCKFQGLDWWNRNALLKCRIDKGSKIPILVDQVWTKKEYVDTCMRRSNTVLSKGCVIPYDDTRAQLDEMANTLRVQRTAALFWHPQLDTVYVFYHLDCPEWQFFERKESAARDDTKLRFVYRSALPRKPIISSDPAALAQRDEWQTLIGTVPTLTIEPSTNAVDLGGLSATFEGNLNLSSHDINRQNGIVGAESSTKPDSPQAKGQAEALQHGSGNRQDPSLAFKEVARTKIPIAQYFEEKDNATAVKPRSPTQTLTLLSKSRGYQQVSEQNNPVTSSPSEHPAEVSRDLFGDRNMSSADPQSTMSPRILDSTQSEVLDTSSRLQNVFDTSIRWFKPEAKSIDTYVFYIMYPATEKEEEQMLVEFLERKDGCYTFAESTTNGFSKFSNLLHKPRTLGVVLMHNEYKRYASIPGLAQLLKGQSQVPRSKRDSLCKLNIFAVSISHEVGPSEYMERVFPYGMCILVTEALMRNAPKIAIAIFKWFLRTNQGKQPGTWKLLVRPNIRSWLKDLLASNEDLNRRQLWADIHLVLNDLIPLCSIRRIKSSTPHATDDRDGDRDIESDAESIGNDGDPRDEDISYPLISPRPIPKYGKAPSDPRVSQSTKDEHTMIEWFAGWAYKKASRYRNFIAVTTESLKEWKKWNHIDIVKPDQFMADMQIDNNGEKLGVPKSSKRTTNSSTIRRPSETKTPSVTSTPRENDGTPKEVTP